MHPSSILVTGFEPFAGVTRNPSAEVVRAVAGMFAAGEVVAEVLPVEYTAAADRLASLLSELNPSAWIGFGLSQRASAITLERTAVNLDDAAIADNAGDLRRGMPIDPNGPAIYRSTLPLKLIHAELTEKNIPAVYSDDAGKYVCNHLFYRGIAAIEREKRTIPGGFVHLPWPCDWSDIPAPGHHIPFNQLISAAGICIARTIDLIERQNSRSA